MLSIRKMGLRDGLETILSPELQENSSEGNIIVRELALCRLAGLETARIYVFSEIVLTLFL